MMKSRYLVMIGLTAIAGCGGGGSDTQPPLVQLAIDSGNAREAARVSWESANDSADMADLAGSSSFIASVPDGGMASLSPATGTLDLVSVVNSIPIGPQTLLCQVSGTIVITGDLTDPLTLTPGDTITIEASKCDDGLGEVIDGLLQLTVDGFAGDFLGGLYELTMSLDLTNFQVATASEVSTANGDATVTLDTTAAPAVSASISGLSMTTDTNSASATLTNYLTETTVDAGISPSPYTLDAQGTLDSTELAGVVTYSTPTTFAGFDTDYPSSGVLLISGESSAARLTAVDNVNVRIDVDGDGDGVFEESVETTWAALTGE